MGPQSRGRRAGTVQSTNDSSALSKRSLAAHGYVRDAFAALLVPGPVRRTPLIHRGYYVRARAVRHCVRAFLQRTGALPTPTRAQVLSLGAGSDSLYFRLKAAGLLARTAVWEVDFPDVSRSKAERIREIPELCSLTGPFQLGDSSSALCFESSDYRILGADLRELPKLGEALDCAGLDAAAPTLLLAEAVLTYLEPADAAALIAWAAQRFPDALFVIYEQMKPRDAFGQIMLQHFRRLHSPLHGLELFPDVEAQVRRFLQAGWTACSALDLNEFYRRLLPADERRRVETLEPFDEFEEWHLKCAHYFILAASRGDTLSGTPVLPPPETSFWVDPALPSGFLSARAVTSDQHSSLKRYGHASVLLSPGIIFSAGGFGEEEGRHCRVSTFHLLWRSRDSEWKSSQISTLGTGGQWDGRLYHTMTKLSDTQVLVLGGRLSPVTPASGALQLELYRSEADCPESQTVTVTEAAMEEGPVLSCWRHSTTEVYYQNQRYLFVYGGRSVVEPVLSDCRFLHVETMAWVPIPVEGAAPEGRHSHSACSWQGGALIAGGLGASEEPLSSVLFLRPKSSGFLWESIDIQPPITPRYSHTAHVFHGKLLLVGGVWIHSSSVPGVTVIDLTTGSSSEYQLDTTSVPWPVMLHSHSSVLLPEEQQILLTGGGGNCFSFGTYFNPHTVALDLSSLSTGQ